MLRPWLERVVSGAALDEAEARRAFDVVMGGEAPATQTAALLVGLAARGETLGEVLGAARSLRAHAVPLTHGLPQVLDTCGTGGDGVGSFNISTAVAFVCAAAGIPVGKHGNRAVSSRAGSADVLEALGVPLQSDPAAAARALAEDGFAFLFAPAWHPAMRHVAPVRRELGVRTVMNLLGPMANPACATHQLVGVYAASRVELMARVLGQLGLRRAVVVHGHGGLDEVSPAGPTQVVVAEGGEIRAFTTTPEAVGLQPVPLEALGGGDAQENARLLLDVLEGRPGARREAVLLNAAWALYAGEVVATAREGVALARELIDRGAAREVLARAQRRGAEGGA